METDKEEQEQEQILMGRILLDFEGLKESLVWFIGYYIHNIPIGYELFDEMNFFHVRKAFNRIIYLKVEDKELLKEFGDVNDRLEACKNKRNAVAHAKMGIGVSEKEVKECIFKKGIELNIDVLKEYDKYIKTTDSMLMNIMVEHKYTETYKRVD